MKLSPEVKEVAEMCYYVGGKFGGDPMLVGNLLLGTALIESNCVDREQDGGGPGLSLWQIEPDTAHWLMNDYLMRHAAKRIRIEIVTGIDIPFAKGVDDLKLPAYDLLACCLARLRYLTTPDPIPETLEGQARYWKKEFNRGGPERGLQASDYVDRWMGAVGHDRVDVNVLEGSCI